MNFGEGSCSSVACELRHWVSALLARPRWQSWRKLGRGCTVKLRSLSLSLVLSCWHILTDPGC